MGEASEDVQDGTCCQFCGIWHDDLLSYPKTADGKLVPWEPPGHPWTCEDCSKNC